MAFDTDNGFGDGVDMGGFSGGSNDSKNAGDKSTQAGNGNEGTHLEGVTGLFGATTPEQDFAIATRNQAPNVTGIGLIDSKISSISTDPLGFLIDAAIGLTPAGMLVSAFGALAKATSTDPSGITSLGAGISAGIRGALRGDITGDTSQQIQREGLNRQVGRDFDSSQFPDQPQQTLQQPSGNQSAPQQSSVVQPSVPLSQPGVRGSNPYAPAAPLQSIDSVWF